MTLLTTPAIAQAHAAKGAQRPAKDAPPIASPEAVRSDANSIRPAVAANATSQGTTAGDGPGANGLSQGSIMKKKAAMDCINVGAQAREALRSWVAGQARNDSVALTWMSVLRPGKHARLSNWTDFHCQRKSGSANDILLQPSRMR